MRLMVLAMFIGLSLIAAAIAFAPHTTVVVREEHDDYVVRRQSWFGPARVTICSAPSWFLAINTNRAELPLGACVEAEEVVKRRR